MYGIIITAILTGVTGIYFIKKKALKSSEGKPIQIEDKDRVFFRYIVGGIMFGLGWGIVGCCPGPIFILLGTGILSVFIILIGALLGTYVYGILKDKLPH